VCHVYSFSFPGPQFGFMSVLFGMVVGARNILMMRTKDLTKFDQQRVASLSILEEIQFLGPFWSCETHSGNVSLKKIM